MKVPAVISYFILALIAAAGVLMMTGQLLGAAEKSTRMVFGGMLIVYAVYRAIVIFGRFKVAKLEGRREEMKKQTDKLLKRK